MGYQLKRSQSVAKGLARIRLEQIDAALTSLDAPNMPLAQRAHETRKAIKRLRALLRLAPPRPERDLEDAYFREAGRALGALREDTVAADTFRSLNDMLPGAAQAKAIPAWLARPALDTPVVSGDEIRTALDSARYLLTTVRNRPPQWPALRGFALLAPGVHKTATQIRRRYREFECNADANVGHRLRKAVKYHRYQVQIIEPAARELLGAYCRELDTLGELLGDQHDLDDFMQRVLRAAPSGAATDVAQLRQVAERRRRELRVESLAAGARLTAESPDALLRRMRRYFSIWRGTRDRA